MARHARTQQPRGTGGCERSGAGRVQRAPQQAGAGRPARRAARAASQKNSPPATRSNASFATAAHLPHRVARRGRLVSVQLQQRAAAAARAHARHIDLDWSAGGLVLLGGLAGGKTRRGAGGRGAEAGRRQGDRWPGQRPCALKPPTAVQPCPGVGLGIPQHPAGTAAHLVHASHEIHGTGLAVLPQGSDHQTGQGGAGMWGGAAAGGGGQRRQRGRRGRKLAAGPSAASQQPSHPSHAHAPPNPPWRRRPGSRQTCRRRAGRSWGSAWRRWCRSGPRSHTCAARRRAGRTAAGCDAQAGARLLNEARGTVRCSKRPARQPCGAALRSAHPADALPGHHDQNWHLGSARHASAHASGVSLDTWGSIWRGCARWQAGRRTGGSSRLARGRRRVLPGRGAARARPPCRRPGHTHRERDVEGVWLEAVRLPNGGGGVLRAAGRQGQEGQGRSSEAGPPQTPAGTGGGRQAAGLPPIVRDPRRIARARAVPPASASWPWLPRPAGAAQGLRVPGSASSRRPSTWIDVLQPRETAESCSARHAPAAVPLRHRGGQHAASLAPAGRGSHRLHPTPPGRQAAGSPAGQAPAVSCCLHGWWTDAA